MIREARWFAEVDILHKGKMLRAHPLGKGTAIVEDDGSLFLAVEDDIYSGRIRPPESRELALFILSRAPRSDETRDFARAVVNFDCLHKRAELVSDDGYLRVKWCPRCGAKCDDAGWWKLPDHEGGPQ